tara:strand:- start:375 stop:695 length:321 start_codon:yes stop_codon:yes gene_type:complete
MKFNLTSAKDLIDLAKKLTVGLRKLSIEDNMEVFKVKDLEITAGSTVTIRNKLTFVPSQYIITSQKGNALVTKTGTWTNKFLYLKNNIPHTEVSGNDVIITVIFMR